MGYELKEMEVKKERDLFYLLSTIQFLFYPIFASLYSYGIMTGDVLDWEKIK